MDLREIDVVLNEISRISQRTEVFKRFMSVRVEVNTLFKGFVDRV